MGCGGSKVDEFPLVIRCRERKELIRAAADHRYALAAAHVDYFRSLTVVGDALRRFVDEELVIASPSDSPVLTLPSGKGKSKKNKNKSGNHKNSSSSTSLSHSGSGSHIHLSDDDDDDDDFDQDRDGGDSHLHLSSGSDSELGSDSGHIHIHDSPGVEVEGPSYSSPTPQTGWGPYGVYPPPQTADWGPYGGYPPEPPPQTSWSSYVMNSPSKPAWDQYGVNSTSTSYAYYMKRSSPQVQSVIYDPTKPDTSYSYLNSYSSDPYENSGFFGFRMSSPPGGPQNQQQNTPAGPPPPPSPPKVSAWNFLNPFDGYDSGYPGYYSYSRHGGGSIASSPDSNEVREREGIPDLEDETETEAYRKFQEGENLNKDRKKNSGVGTSRAVPSQKQSSEGSSKTVQSHGSSEGTTRGIPPQHNEGTSRKVPSPNSKATHSVDVKEEKGSPDSIISIITEDGSVKSTEDGSERKKGVTFEVDAASMHKIESPKLRAKISAHGTRDLQEAVTEIRDDFATASSFGKEVAMLLEAGKVPYQPRFSLHKVILSRIAYMVAPSLSSSHPPSRRSVRYTFRTMKLAKSYYEDLGKNTNMKPCNLSSTLEKLYVWEKKLYKEVKDEERLRVIYEKQCKMLKVLDDRGAESSKIDATRASVRKLLTKLNVCVKAVETISSRIQKLRDEELQPQVTELIYGLRRMWKTMLKCHQKQFQAIMESKTSLRANTRSRRDSNLRATIELEMELRAWFNRFSEWIKTQKSFIESLNGWLLRCLVHEPEESPDGIVPFSPGRIGAPPIFVICNDWFQAMETISEIGAPNAIRNFASSLLQLWEKQDEEQKQRLKAEYLSKDFEKRLKTLRMERGRMERGQDAMSDKTSGSLVPSENGVSPLDDLKVDLDSMRKRLEEEKARHKEAAKLVHNAASSSLQGGLIPIFEELSNFTSEALKAYEHVRIENQSQKTGGK
ncbi:hypothetical protein CsSME_00034993 [Camellia sinensis var. sinensis]